MSKRSRDASFSPASDESPPSAIQDECDALAGNAPPKRFSLTDSDASAAIPARVMQCTLAPHRETVCFDTQEEYEVHYNKEHTNRCATCSKNFPTCRFLELHIEENHNALREALAARGERTYGCFVEDCDRKCSTPQKRRLHLIDKHMFPRTYNFRIIDQGIDKASSMLREGRRRRVSTANDNYQVGRHRRQTSTQLRNDPTDIGERETNQELSSQKAGYHVPGVVPRKMDMLKRSAAPDDRSQNPLGDVDSLTRSLSVLRFVPTGVLRKQNRKSMHPDTKQAE